jgi:hypothetical protein
MARTRLTPRIQNRNLAPRWTRGRSAHPTGTPFGGVKPARRLRRLLVRGNLAESEATRTILPRYLHRRPRTRVTKAKLAREVLLQLGLLPAPAAGPTFNHVDPAPLPVTRAAPPATLVVMGGFDFGELPRPRRGPPPRPYRG